MAKAGSLSILEEFEQRHNEQIESRGSKDVFFVWLVFMFLSVVGAHFLLNITPGIIPTGYVTAEADAVQNLSLLVDAFFVLFVTVLVGALAFSGITKHDK